MKPSKFLSLSALAIPASLAFSHSALAANINWTGSSGTDWNGPGNPPWSNGTKPASGDVAVFSTAGTNTVANAVGDQVVSGMTFDTAAGSFTIGTTGGNKFTLTTGNTIQIAATLAGSNLTETIDSPIVFGSGAAAVTYNFSNINTNASNKLVFGGALSGGTTLTTMLTLTGVNTGNNAVNGLISNGLSSALSINKTSTGTWILGNASNSFTGGVQISQGILNTASIGNSGSDSALGTNGTIKIGNSTSTGTLLYTGSGETSNKIIDLSGQGGGATIDTTGATGGLVLTGINTASVINDKTLTLTGNTTGNSIGAIVDSTLKKTSVLKSGTGTWALTGTHTYSGATTVSAGTLSLTGSLTGATAITASGGTFTQSNTGVISNAAATLTTSGGSTTLSALNTYTGATSVNNGGTLNLDFSAAAAPLTAINIINNAANTSALTLGGGTLVIKGGGSTAVNSQRFNGTTFTSGKASFLSIDQNSATTINVTLGGLSRNGGSTVDFTVPTGSTITSTTTTSTGTNKINGNGIAYSTANGGTTWLVNNSGTFSALAPGLYQTDLFAASGDTDITANDAPVAFTNNTLRFNTASKTLTLASTGVSTVTSGGILVTSSGTGSVIDSAGGSAGLTAGATGKEIVVHNYGTLDISAPIVNNGANVIALTIAGAGTTTLSGANTFTGSTYIDSGTLKLSNSLALQNSTFSGGSGGTLVFDSSVGTNAFTFGNLNSSTAFALQNNAGTPAAIALTVGGNGGSGIITGVISGSGSIIKVGAGALRFFNSGVVADFSGGLFINVGSLSNQLSSAGSQTIGTGSITFANGTTYSSGNNTLTNNLVLTSGTVTNSSATGASMGSALTGTISGSGGFLVSMNGGGAASIQALVLSGTGNSFSGGITLSPIGVTAHNYDIRAFTNGALGSGVVTLNAPTLAGTSRLVLGAQNATSSNAGNATANQDIDGLVGAAGTQVIGNSTVSGGSTLTISPGTVVSNTFAGVIGGGGTNNNNLKLVMNGVAGSTQTLTGANTYTGTTTINSGTLRIDGSQTAATGAITVKSSGFLGGNGASGAAVTMESGGGLAAKITDWTGSAGTGYDDLDVVSFNGASVPINLSIDTTGLTNFTETTKSFIILKTSGLVTDLGTVGTPAVTGFSGTGTWS